MGLLRWIVLPATLILLASSANAREIQKTQGSDGSTAKPCKESPEGSSRYTVILADPAGLLTTWNNKDGTIGSCFEFNDRGRGPRLWTTTAIGVNAIPSRLVVTGNDYLKNSVDETFSAEGGKAAWSNRAESGSKDEAGNAFYVPLNSSPNDTAIMARALLAAPGRKLTLLPSGKASIERVTELKVEAAGQSRSVAEYAISGLGFSPQYIWLDSNGGLFAEVSPWQKIVLEGWESTVPALLASQEKSIAARDVQLARSLGRKPGGLLVIRHARLFDSETATVKPDTTILITGNRISKVLDSGAPLKIPRGATVIDARGQTLMPGLWDMHVHLSEGDGLLDVANGVTTVRDLANDIDKLLAMKRSFDNGTAIGPRVVLAGVIDGKGPYAGPTKMLVSTPEEAKADVDTYARLGYVQIKIYSSVRPDLVPGIVKEAHRLGLRVSGHIPAFMTAEQAVKDGYNEIQHINFLFLNFLFDEVQDTRTPARFTFVARDAAGIDLNSQRVRAFIKLLKDHDIKIDPTLNVFENQFTARPGSVSPTYAEVADRLPVQVRRGFMNGGLPVPAGLDQRYRDSFQACLNFVKELYSSGIEIEAGTDSLAGFTLARELELDVMAGIPAPRVLQLTTLGDARIMKMDRDLGSIAPGKLADMILVDGRPDEKIGDIRRVTTVIKDGVVYGASDLDRALGVAPISSLPAPTTKR